MELSKTAEEVYKQQKEQIASSRAVGDTTGAGATGKTDETVFSIEVMDSFTFFKHITYCSLV